MIPFLILVAVLANIVGAIILVAIIRKWMTSKMNVLGKLIEEGNLIYQRLESSMRNGKNDIERNHELKENIRKDILAAFDTDAMAKLARDKLASLISDDEELRALFIKQLSSTTEATVVDLCHLTSLGAFMGGVENGHWPKINEKTLAMTFFIPAVNKDCKQPTYPINYTIARSSSESTGPIATVEVNGYGYNGSTHRFYATTRKFTYQLSTRYTMTDDAILFQIFRTYPAKLNMEDMIDYFHNKGMWC